MRFLQIKVKACGVCGTDLHIHEGEFIAKVRLGHFLNCVVEQSRPAHEYGHRH